MLGNAANHAHHTIAPDDATLLADAADGGTNFHAAGGAVGEEDSGEGAGAGMALGASMGVPGRKR